MRGLLLGIAYLLVIVFAASVLSWLLAGAFEYDYFKVLSKTIQLTIVLSVIPLWRWLDLDFHLIRLESWQTRELFLWVGAGVLSLLPLILFFVVTGFRVLDTRVLVLSPEFLLTLVTIIVGALMVAVFEEILFRGVLYTLFRRVWSVLVSSLGVSMLYAAVHFLRTEDNLVALGVFSGFTYLREAVAGLDSVGEDIGSFGALVLLSLVLIWAREKFNLWVCIALHASWVMCIRVFKELTVRDIVNPFEAWVGTYDNFIGPLALFWLVFIVVVIRLHRHHRLNFGEPPGATRGKQRQESI
ncbi:MAG: CPBP family intramembrane metalloprotease [Pseudomonadales bacterium]|nr:CPBP family intramembrane metalloprotease [Pseudomonadales bacterium]